MVRAFTKQDLEHLQELQKKHYDFSFPDLTHAKCITMVEIEGEVIGGGIVREIPEACLILDKDKSLRLKCKALKELINFGDSFTRSLRHQGIYGFVHEDDYEQLLIKHFGFVRASGNLLYKGV
tara:strand:+ start:318 stop:686 length:369 start_codon:yes stop_codon:yes gene_type:complete